MNGKRMLGVAMALTVAGLGARADDAAAHGSSAMNASVYAATNKATEGVRILFVGNSITLHGPLAAIGWTNNWGMAASAPEKDFVHVVARGVERHFGRKASLMVRNIADFERDFRAYDFSKLDALEAFAPDVMVVALGENSPNLPTEKDRQDYCQAYRRLFSKLLGNRRTKPLSVVRGVFWANEAKDAAMAAAADDFALPFVKTSDLASQPGMDASDTGFAHAGIRAHPGDRGMAAIAGRLLEALFPTRSGYSAKMNGKAVRVRPIRISAQPFNRFPSEPWQRPSDQTEVAGMVNVEAKGATTWSVRPERAFTNVVVRPLAAHVKATAKDGEISFVLPRAGHYVLELDGCRSPLELFVEPKRDFAQEKAEATLFFGPGNHLAGPVKLKSHDRVYIDKDAFVYGMFEIEDAEDVQISGYGVICGTTGRRFVPKGVAGGSPTPIRMCRARNVRVYGPTVIDSAEWCVAAFACSDIELSHLKVTGAWRYNTDGVDICNSENVSLHDSYVHSFDDAIAVKGLPRYRALPVRNVRVERCTCWCGWGVSLETGLETWASEWKDVVFSDCDLIRNSMTALGLSLGGPCKVESTAFRGVRIEYDTSVRRPQIQAGRADRYGFASAGPWNGNWLRIANAKMFAPGMPWSDPSVSPDEPFGSFGRVSFEDIRITVGEGAPLPGQQFDMKREADFGKIDWNGVWMNDRPLVRER